jgi:hypothetical protein
MIVFQTMLSGILAPFAPFLSGLSNSSRFFRIDRSVLEKCTRPGLKSGRGVSGEPGKKKNSIVDTKIVNKPSTTTRLGRNIEMRDDLLTQEKPLPSIKPTVTCKLEDSRSQYWAQCISTEHPKEQNRNSLRKFTLSIPARQSVRSSWYITSFRETQKKSRSQESAPTFHKNLHYGDESEDADLSRDPFSWSKPLQN